jgi:hypothetical protein
MLVHCFLKTLPASVLDEGKVTKITKKKQNIAAKMGKVKKNWGKRQRELTLRKSTNLQKLNTSLKLMRFCGGNKKTNFREGKEFLVAICQPLDYNLKDMTAEVRNDPDYLGIGRNNRNYRLVLTSVKELRLDMAHGRYENTFNGFEINWKTSSNCCLC